MSEPKFITTPEGFQCLDLQCPYRLCWRPDFDYTSSDTPKKVCAQGYFCACPTPIPEVVYESVETLTHAQIISAGGNEIAVKLSEEKIYTIRQISRLILIRDTHTNLVTRCGNFEEVKQFFTKEKIK